MDSLKYLSFEELDCGKVFVGKHPITDQTVYIKKVDGNIVFGESIDGAFIPAPRRLITAKVWKEHIKKIYLTPFAKEVIKQQKIAIYVETVEEQQELMEAIENSTGWVWNSGSKPTDKTLTGGICFDAPRLTRFKSESWGREHGFTTMYFSEYRHLLVRKM